MEEMSPQNRAQPISQQREHPPSQLPIHYHSLLNIHRDDADHANLFVVVRRRVFRPRGDIPIRTEARHNCCYAMSSESPKVFEKTPLILWERLPCELLRAIVEASSSPSSCYIQLLSLSHAIRTSIRGTLRELCFIPSLTRPTITADAMAALVGPCISLNKLSFPIPEGWQEININEAARAGWVDETFGGHTRLAVLSKFPLPPEPVAERILSHLPGLVELTTRPSFDRMSPRLLATLARYCPGLQVLRCSVSDREHLDALAPLSGTLKELSIQGSLNSDASLTAFVRGLTAMTSLTLHRCPIAALESIASHLTSLDLFEELNDLPGPWLCHLEALSLNLGQELTPLVRLLTVNQATLRSLSLTLWKLKPAEAPSLRAALRALPHLTRLSLFLANTGVSLSALLSPDLVDRLERLNLNTPKEADPFRITSSRLRTLCLSIEPDERCLPTSLQCPRLRTMKLCVQNLMSLVPMPDLEVALFRGGTGTTEDPAWLLDGSSPRLRVLSGVLLTQPDLLAMLCACGSLVRLEELCLDVTRLPNPLVLRLPGQLERLHMRCERAAKGGPLPLDLQVEAPGLLDFQMTIDPMISTLVQTRLHNCPNLARLHLRSFNGPLSIQTDDEGEVSMMQLRSLFIAGVLETAGLLGLLTRHGARLRRVTYWRGAGLAAADWPQLMGALSGLPRLAGLALDVIGGTSHLSLACPELRWLHFGGLPNDVKVVLACPLLARIDGIMNQGRQLELATPAPNLGVEGFGEEAERDDEGDEEENA
ncbi:hypothetical protein PAPYR_7068 [Paratrimastix pyriformis]|uniref:F-box domain-containing protein n=1 Tax=Paratrimastix pyriformis TaxID=342808 RepID=A0ABQ8UJL5_9EUKA|nr:hypothetical protein PAPYR_7068 [Paratrimastix pyriformis]